MPDPFNLFIDLNHAGLGLDPEELEEYSQMLVRELRQDLVDDARLARMAEVPEGSKSGGAGFDLGILKAEVNVENTLKVLGWLRNRIAGATLELEYGDMKLKYRTEAQLEQQLQALEKISHLTVRVVKDDDSES